MKAHYRLLLFTILFCGLAGLAEAQTGRIQGKVHVEPGLTPLPGVNVYLENTSLGTATNADGMYALDDIPVGRYTLIASSVGFQPFRETISVRSGTTIELDIVLTEDLVEIDEIIVERVMMTNGNHNALDIPGSAYYVDAREIDQYSYNDIHRVLRRVPGVNVQEEDGYGLRPNIGMRGTGAERSSKITVMEDGVLAAPAPYSAPAAYYFPTAGRMHGVEVRKGSSQIKYGPYTTGGALNLLSTPIPASLSGRVNLLAGAQEDRTLHASAGHSFKNIGFLVETYQAKTQGFKTLESGGDTGFDKADYLAKLRFNTSPSARIPQSITFKASSTEETSDETYLGLTEDDFYATPYLRYAGSQADVMETSHREYSARHVVRFSDHIDLTTTAYRTEFARDWFKLDKVRSGAGSDRVKIGQILENPTLFAGEYDVLRGQPQLASHALDVKHNNRSYYAQGIESIAGFSLDNGAASHEIEAGVRYHIDEIDRFQWVDTYQMRTDGATAGSDMMLVEAGTPGTESNRIGKARALASHVQYRYKQGRLTVTPGLRFEHITLSRDDFGKEDPGRTGTDLRSRENTVDVWIPGIGADYAWTSNVHSFMGIHKGFAPPGSTPGAQPEESVNYEAGLRLYKNRFYLTSVGFFNDYKNLLGADLAASGGQGSGDSFNGGSVHTYGLELRSGYDAGPLLGLPAALPLHLSYTYTRATFQNTFESDFEAWGNVEKGDALPYVPQHQLALSLGLETDRATFEISGSFTDKMRTQAGQGFIPAQSTEAHLVIDASGTLHLNQHVRLFLSIRNLTNKTYIAARRPAGLRPGLPRLILFGIKTTF